jgi:hypothetical protein
VLFKLSISCKNKFETGLTIELLVDLSALCSRHLPTLFVSDAESQALLKHQVPGQMFNIHVRMTMLLQLCVIRQLIRGLLHLFYSSLLDQGLRDTSFSALVYYYRCFLLLDYITSLRFLLNRSPTARRGICEQDTLNPQLWVAMISRIACGTPNVSKKQIILNFELDT